MPSKEDFQAVAVRLFNTFGDFVIDATYIQETSSYVAGGNLTAAAQEYPIRLLRDNKNITLTLAGDIPWDSSKYLMIASELPVTPNVKDKIRIGSETRAILAIDPDPGDIITILYVG